MVLNFSTLHVEIRLKNEAILFVHAPVLSLFSVIHVRNF